MALLREHFGEEGFVYTREPGGTALGKEVREILLHRKLGDVSEPAELFLFFADRAQHVEEVIKPALAAGKTVISNRSYISFLAYQVYGRQQFGWQPLIEQIIAMLFAECPIDLAVVLDVDAAVGLERQKHMGKNPDRIEQGGLALHERIRKGFFEAAKTAPSIIVDGNRPVEAVWTDVRQAVESTL
jgi:dTMP kinase